MHVRTPSALCTCTRVGSYLLLLRVELLRSLHRLVLLNVPPGSLLHLRCSQPECFPAVQPCVSTKNVSSRQWQECACANNVFWYVQTMTAVQADKSLLRLGDAHAFSDLWSCCSTPEQHLAAPLHETAEVLSSQRLLAAGKPRIALQTTLLVSTDCSGCEARRDPDTGCWLVGPAINMRSLILSVACQDEPDVCIDGAQVGDQERCAGR